MTDLHCEHLVGSTGGRTALLFMHAPGLDSSYYRPHVEPLAKRFDLTFFDQRLNGRSPRTSNAPVTLDVLAEDVRAVRRQMTNSKVIAVAHSFASWVAIYAAAKWADLFSGVVLVSPAVRTSAGATLLEHAVRCGTRDQRETLEAAFSGRVATDQQLAEGWRRILPLYFYEYPADEAEQMLLSIQFSIVGFREFLDRCFGAIDCFVEVGRVRVPILVLTGDSDWVEKDPTGGSQALAAAANANLAILPACGHFPFVERSRLFTTVVDEWAAARGL